MQRPSSRPPAALLRFLTPHRAALGDRQAVLAQQSWSQVQ